MAASFKPLQLVVFCFLALLFVSGGAVLAGAASEGTTSNGTAAATATTTTTTRARSLASSPSSAQGGGGGAVFSLDRYGARGDGSHDDTPALAKAWKAACASPRPAVVLVPGGKRYLLKLVTLSGPCKSSVVFTVKGTLVASPNRADWSDGDRRHWIVFSAVDKLTVNGGGAVDGNGETWWKNSCKINKAMVSVDAVYMYLHASSS
jgi:polygalacturonase